jgi:hypothetical protein
VISHKHAILHSSPCVSITWFKVGYSDDRFITRTRGGERGTVYSTKYGYYTL